MIKQLIEEGDLQKLQAVLSNSPSLANEEIEFDEVNKETAHPLHRICDAVFNRRITDEEAVNIATIFLQHGAKIDGNKMLDKKDTPLIAASSLHADKVALLYIDKGANIHHAGTLGGTALHWAAWCGRDVVVKRLLQENPSINQRCVDFMGTPLLWAVHGYKKGGPDNIHRQIDCVRLLLEAGADKSIPNIDQHTPVMLLDQGDEALNKLLS